MGKVIIDSNEFENTFVKVANVNSTLAALSEKIEQIKECDKEKDLPLEYRPKCIAIGIAFTLQDYTDYIYKELRELLDKAPTIERTSNEVGV